MEIENEADCGSQNEKAKSAVVAQICRIVRRAGLDYDNWRYVAKRVRQQCELRPAKKGRKLPKVLTADHFKKFYEQVDRAGDAQHGLMLRLLFFCGVRVSELCNVLVADVDLDNCHIRVNQGKGAKDRVVLFSKTLATALRTHVAAHSANRYLFQTRRNTKYTARRVQQVVKLYAERAGVTATPHTFRHQFVTWLTRHSGLADAELQLLTGHSRRETLNVYQHVSLDVDLEQKYHAAMRAVDL